MRHTGTSRTRTRSQVGLILIGAVSLLMMPVDYRAGASIAHPHAIIQLMSDLAHGSHAHHAHDHTSFGHARPNDTRHHLMPLPDRVVTSMRDSGLARRAPAASPAPVIAALTMLANDAAPAVPAADEPALSHRTAPGKYIVYALALAVVAVLAWQWLDRRLHWLQAVAWRGLTLAPEPPPPRTAARRLSTSLSAA